MDGARDKVLGILLLVAGMALFGSATPISKLVGEGLPVFTASLFRVVLGAVSLLPFVVGDLARHTRALSRRDWGYLSLISLFGMVGFTVFLIYGMKFVSGVAGSIVMSFTPALTALAAFAFMGSPMDWRRTVAVGLGVAGVVVIHVFKGQFDVGGSPHFYVGVALVLAAIGCEACYTLVGKKATEQLPPLFTSFMACAMSIPAFVLLALIDIGQVELAAVSATSWGALLWWGIGTLGAGSALWYSGVSRTEGTTAAGFMAVMPLSALVLSYVLLGEPFRPIHALGIALVLASVALMSWVHAGAMRDTDEEGDESPRARDARLLSSCHCPATVPRPRSRAGTT
jgi:drug/metabolite transporter (DMT)-like permease